MNDRDKKVMEMFEKKTPGKWKFKVSKSGDGWIEAERLDGVENFNSDIITLEDDFKGYPECGEHLIMNLLSEDKEFIEESSTGWPQDFYGRMVAERENELLLKWATNSDCEYAEEDPDYCFGKNCGECLSKKIHRKALASLAEEGIKIPEGE